MRHRKGKINLFSDNDIQMIKKSLDNGNNILIRKSRNDILILEQRTKTLSRFDKDRQISEKENKET